MTNYAQALYDLTGGMDGRADNIAHIVTTFDRTEGEATLLQDTVHKAIRDACRAIGAAIDTVPVFDGMQADVVALICAQLPGNMVGLAEHMLMAAMGGTTTPGCDCDACKVKLNLEAQVRITQETRG